MEYMTIQEAAKELNKAYKSEKEKKLEDKIEQLENMIINLTNRVEHLEKIIGR